MKIRVESFKVRTDVDLDIYHVELDGDDFPGVWPETFGSRRDLDVFLRGVEATYAIVAGKHLPEVVVPEPDVAIVVLARDESSDHG